MKPPGSSPIRAGRKRVRAGRKRVRAGRKRLRAGRKKTGRARLRSIALVRLAPVLAVLACDGASAPVPDGATGGISGDAAGEIDFGTEGGLAGSSYAGTLPGGGPRYRVLRGRGATSLTPQELGAEVTAADAVCLGELHDNDDHHAVQLLLFGQMATGSTSAERPLALGMEMFQKPFQPAVDEYAAGAIDEATLLARVQWRQRWGFDFAYYRAVVRLAVDSERPLRALNAATEITSKVSRMGLQALTPDERAQIPADLDLSNTAHRAWFRKAIGSSAPSSEEVFERIYTVQVIWDETMADTAWHWLSAGTGSPRRQIAILAGSGHCVDFGIPARLRRRGAGTVLSVKPVYDRNPALADALAEAQSDFLVVMEPPAR